MQFKNQTVWITGGGTGIGRSMALEFGKRGAKLALSGRRIEKLEEAVAFLEEAGIEAAAFACDVTSEAQIADTVAAVVEQFGSLDVAVANAGYSVSGRVEELTADEWRRQFDVNVVGVASTAKHALPELRKTKGRLVIIGSVAGTIASPGVGAYHASKYAVRAVGQVLAMELVGSGVSCTTIQPGFVESDIARVDNSGNFREDWQDKRPQKLMWPSEKAAKVIVSAVHKRKREFTFTSHGKVAAFAGKHAPGLVHVFATKIMKQPYKRREV